ncbi:MAG: glycosyltransferase family 4 protein [Candidatus Zixiibacteriota bacterium]|nr:MAG: glycosyltransferase family 4 protein [candidate division Zixibacteria bacterium]
MKILVVTTSFPLKCGDSLSPFLWEFCRRLKERGWDVTVIVPHHKGVKEEDDWEGIAIKRFRYLPESMENFAYSGGLLPGLKRNPFRIFGVLLFINAMYRKVIKTIDEGNFDIVNVHWLFPAAFWANRLYRKRSPAIVFTGHGTDVQLTRKFPFNKFADNALGAASGLTLNSRYMQRILRGRAVPEKIEIIPMGTDTDKFRPAETKPSKSKKILFIGRLIKQKGVDMLIEAYSLVKKSYPDAELEIIGYGTEKTRLLGIVKSLGLWQNVTFSDAVEYDKLTEKYRAARILAFPSLIGEGFGMTVAEAAACGIPTITFGLGGTAELVVDNETGMIVSPNVGSLSEGLKRLYSDDTLVDDMGERARKRIEDHYNWEIIGDKFDRFFKDILSREK